MLIIYIISAVITAFVLIVILTPSAKPFDLKACGRDEDLFSEVRRLATDSRTAKRGGKVDLHAFSACKKAMSILRGKEARGEQIEGYERALLDGSHAVWSAMNDVLPLRSMKDLPFVGDKPAVLLFAEKVVSHLGENLSKENFALAVNVYNAVRPFSWKEICALYPCVQYALLECVNVYASKIVKRRALLLRALKDGKRLRVSEEDLKYNSYIKALLDFSGDVGDVLQNKLRKYSVVPSEVYDIEEKTLSRYALDAEGYVRGLTAFGTEREYLLSLSASAQMLENSPYVDFSRLTPKCKCEYLCEINRTAEKLDLPEIERVKQIIALTRVSGKNLAKFVLPREYNIHGVRLLFDFAFATALCVLTGFFDYVVGVLAFLPYFIAGDGLFLHVLRLFTHVRPVPEYVEDEDAPLTAVFYTAYVSGENALSSLFDKIEEIAVLNRRKYLSFGLLLDAPKSYTNVAEDVRREYQTRKTKLFVALRSSAWERKRGAILQFNDLVLNCNLSAFALVLGEIKQFTYAITLDDDALLRDCHRLVGIMRHPYNARYAVGAVKVRSSVRTQTPFARLHTGGVGYSTYDDGETVWNVSGFGNYTGKGIYRIREFNDLLMTRFPEKRLLSHDLVEGAVARTVQTPVCIVDEFPSSYASYQARLLRWIRGDVGLFPLLFKPLPLGAKCIITVNIMTALGYVFSLVLFVLAVFGNPLALVAFAPQAFWVLTSFSSQNITEIAKQTVRQVIFALTLPTFALNVAWNVLTTVFGLTFKKNLLVWKPSSAGGKCYFVGNYLVCALCFVWGVAFGAPLSVLFSAFFLLPVVVDGIISHTYREKRNYRLEADCEKLLRGTWQYFESAFSPSGLPYDNYQEGKGWADRTSPTNIGLALTSVIIAERGGLITQNHRDDLLNKTLTALEGLEKYKGCPYNWYECSTALPLSPKYVSTVDCGNLATALMTVVGLGGEIGARAQKLLDETDVSFLYDEDKKLLRVGYDVTTSTPDGCHYDLLGSEASLAYVTFSVLGLLRGEAYYELSRHALSCRGRGVLASWTGGIFEYALPLVFTTAPRYSLVEVSARRACKAHFAYARAKHAPVLAMSEALYGAVNDVGDYAYKAFGLSKIALSGEGRDVFAPYAEVMARALTRKGDFGGLEKFMSSYGLYDSYDLDTKTTQRAVMSHHQGMIMLALGRVLGVGTDGLLCQTACGRAMKFFFDEDCSVLRNAKPVQKKTERKEERIFYTTAPRSYYPQLNYLSGADYRLVIDEYGRNFQHVGGLLLSRYDRPEGLRLFFTQNGKTVEPTTKSTCVHAPTYSAYYYDGEGVTATVTASVDAKENLEYRTIEFYNPYHVRREIEITALVKPCLTYRSADLANKAYSSMHVTTSYASHDFAYACRIHKPENVLALMAEGAEYYGNEDSLYSSGERFGATVTPVLALKKKLLIGKGRTEYKIYLTYTTLSHARALKRRLDYGLLFSATPSRVEALPRDVRLLGSAIVSKNVLGQTPTVLVTANDSTVEKAERTLKALRRLREYGAEFFTTVLVTENIGYRTPVRKRVEENVPPFATVIAEQSLSLAEKAELYATCMLVDGVTNAVLPPYFALPTFTGEGTPVPVPQTEYRLEGCGFTASGEFVIGRRTPLPWVNVLASDFLGAIISTEGGFTFASNSQTEKITPHAGEEYGEAHGDGIFLGEGGTLWSITQNPQSGEAIRATVHGFGSTEFICGQNGLIARQDVFVHEGTKYYVITLSNLTDYEREIDVACYAELLLGGSNGRGDIITGLCEGGAMAERGNLTVYLTCSEKTRGVAFSAESYRDRSGKFKCASNFNAQGSTPALALSTRVTLTGGGEKRLAYALSVKPEQVTLDRADCAKRRLREFYGRFFEIESDEQPLKYFLKWLPYQTYASRWVARCGNQQTGGAIGFRDQLQDGVALTEIMPSEVRAHVLECASKQFEKGDVLHWYHRPSVGVRTRVCDDRLYLPYATVEYVERTGDEGILDELAPYLEDKPLRQGDSSAYGYVPPSKEVGTLRDHCLRAISSVELSPRNLVLMGGGDWNDGMDSVGDEGKGESVLCSMFLYYVIERFLPYAPQTNADELKALRRKLGTAVEKCFVGDRYVRAYDDEGEPIGVEDNEECKIDLTVQAWAVLSGIAKGERARKVLTTAVEKLTDHGIVRLLAPPFKKTDVGYIADYPEGVRENGGQYTHGAVWFIWALYEAGLQDKANELLTAILPTTHSATDEGITRYKREPYVIAGDVYSGDLLGRGGWTWYTGSAGWLYRLIVEKYYGILRSAKGVRFAPNLPDGKLVKLKVGVGDKAYKLVIDSRGAGEWNVEVNGKRIGGHTLLTSLGGKEIRLFKE